MQNSAAFVCAFFLMFRLDIGLAFSLFGRIKRDRKAAFCIG